ncbi:hypothetical protein KCP77_07185 [Salmonella enterica subsp. enterica]|nr:hypothetical protein KCP77_07185 [Salmonella enterica subsp. enterica]
MVRRQIKDLELQIIQIQEKRAAGKKGKSFRKSKYWLRKKGTINAG